MRVPVSKAEIEVMQELCAAGVNERMVTQKPVCLSRTTPDFTFHMPDRNYAVYIDSEQLHYRKHAMQRDAKIDERLDELGWKVLRCVYHIPLSKKRKAEIVREICEFIGRPL